MLWLDMQRADDVADGGVCDDDDDDDGAGGQRSATSTHLWRRPSTAVVSCTAEPSDSSRTWRHGRDDEWTWHGVEHCRTRLGRRALHAADASIIRMFTETIM